jgi:hypothetical protein
MSNLTLEEIETEIEIAEFIENYKLDIQNEQNKRDELAKLKEFNQLLYLISIYDPWARDYLVRQKISRLIDKLFRMHAYTFIKLYNDQLASALLSKLPIFKGKCESYGPSNYYLYDEFINIFIDYKLIFPDNLLEPYYNEYELIIKHIRKKQYGNDDEYYKPVLK